MTVGGMGFIPERLLMMMMMMIYICVCVCIYIHIYVYGKISNLENVTYCIKCPSLSAPIGKAPNGRSEARRLKAPVPLPKSKKQAQVEKEARTLLRATTPLPPLNDTRDPLPALRARRLPPVLSGQTSSARYSGSFA